MDFRSQTARKLNYRRGLLGRERLAGSSELLYLELTPGRRLVSDLERWLAQTHPRRLEATGCQTQERRMRAFQMLDYPPRWAY
jgi:hypothetical protein